MSDPQCSESSFTNTDSLPDVLKHYACWLVANQNKVPVIPQSSQHISGDRQKHCMTFDQAQSLIPSHHAWLVYLHQASEPFSTIDIDNGRNPQTGEPVPWCSQFLNHMAPIGYLEVSASGTGYHLLCVGKLPLEKGKIIYQVTGYTGAKSPKFEIISVNNPVTFTGKALTPQGASMLPLNPLNQATDYLQQHYPEPQPEPDGSPPPPVTRSRTPRYPTGDLPGEHQILDMLSHLEPDCDHDLWKQIGMALHHWSGGSENGKSLWTQWSQGGEKYNRQAQQTINASWRGFKANGGITTATLIKLAREAGWRDRTQQPTPDSPKATSAKPPSAEPPPDTIEPEASVTPINDPMTMINSMVQTMNQHYVHVLTHGANYVYRDTLDAHRNPVWQPMKVTEFKQSLCHLQPMVTGTDTKGRPKYKPVSDLWLNHPNARFSDGLTFYPQTSEDRYHHNRLNLYRGIAVTPIPCQDNDPDLQAWCWHCLSGACQQNKQYFQYLIYWLAHLIQKPWEKPGVCIILKGGQGTGKGLLVNPMLTILGSHGIRIGQPKLITGRFNSAIENKLMVFADEAIFDSRSATNILKSMITEDTIFIERKCMEVMEYKNFSRLIMATNNDSVVRFSPDDRRYFLLEMNEQHKQDADYFQPLIEAINNQKLPGKLLYWLEHKDISQFQPREFPKTEFLTLEKINNLDPINAWLLESLRRGSFINNEGWPTRLETDVVFQWFMQFLDAHRLEVWGNIPMKLGRAIQSVIGATRTRARIGGERIYLYEFKSLDASRTQFENRVFASTIEW
ncbi:MAG: DUF5906 domain-containing protein [Candidatus Thiodiazotropha weberae]|nr:DUF5906 domain-containing protein [Candidatus Thiodiazotropha weberae]